MTMKMTNYVPRFYSAVLLTVSVCCITSGMAIEQSLRTGVLLYGKIGGPSNGTKPNFVFSPLSIFSVFRAAQKGAVENTRSEMDVLVGPEEEFMIPDMGGIGGQNVELDVANKIFVSESLTEVPQFLTFKDQLAADGALVDKLGLSNAAEAASRINGFVAEVTRNHIKNLVKDADLGDDTKLVLVNALYFKGAWGKQFNSAATHQGTFQTPSGPTEVTFMKGDLGDGPSFFYSEDGVETVGIPYKDSRLRMYIVMPSDIDNFESKIMTNPMHLEAIISNMEENQRTVGWSKKVELTIPKFKLTAEDNHVDLVGLFKSLGAVDMFDVLKADFSNITGSRDLYVSSYMHQADIIVDEMGTEATAATAMTMSNRSVKPPRDLIAIKIDKPFIFQIRFSRGMGTPLVLFSGRIADPSSAQ